MKQKQKNKEIKNNLERNKLINKNENFNF